MNEHINYPQIHYMFADMMKLAILVDSILEKRNLRNCIFAQVEHTDSMKFENTLTWRHGSPSPKYSVFTPNRTYIERENPMLHLWKDCDVDSNILDIYTKSSNSMYIQPDNTIELPDDYNLFLLQNIELEYYKTVDAMQYATARKIYTVFKLHPLTKKDEWDKLGHKSEYTIFADSSVNLDYLLDSAKKVFSVWSSVSLNAALRGIPCATYDNISYSEIIPTIKTAYEIDNINAVNTEDLKRFLSWYTHKLCIDTSLVGFEERIEQRIVDFHSGTPIERLLA